MINIDGGFGLRVSFPGMEGLAHVLWKLFENSTILDHVTS